MSGILVDLKTTGKEKSPFKYGATDKSVTVAYCYYLFISFHRLTLVL